MADMVDFDAPTDYVTIDTISAEKARCETEGSKKNEKWSQQPEIISTQVQCLKKYPPPASAEVCEKNFETNQKKAAKLGLDIKDKTARELCKMVNVEEQRRCLYENHKCPAGTLPDWPKNPTCCQPIQKPQTAKAKLKAAVTTIGAISRLKNLSKVYPDVMNLQQQREFLATTTLSKEDQDKLTKESQTWQTRAQTFDSAMPNLSTAEQDYIKVIVKHLESELLQTLKASQTESTKMQTSWARTIATFFANTAKKAFNLVTWIMTHPIMAMWLTQLALRLKRKFCREVSIALGYGGGEKIQTGTIGYLATQAKTLYNENWQAVIMSTMYRFTEGIGFDSVAAVVKDGMSWAINSICVGLLAVPGFGWAAAGGVKFFSFIISSGIESAFKESLREALLMATTELILKDVGANAVELLFGKCFFKQPSEYSWSFWLWAPSNETELREEEKKIVAVQEDLTTNGYLGGLGDDVPQQQQQAKVEQQQEADKPSGGFFQSMVGAFTGNV